MNKIKIKWAHIRHVGRKRESYMPFLLLYHSMYDIKFLKKWKIGILKNN